MTRRRSKGAVLLLAPFFLAAQAVLGVQLERAKPERVDAAFGARLQLLRRQIALRPGVPLVLMLGSSRTMTGLRPDLLKDRPYITFNFGREGTGPVKNLIHVRRLLAEGIRPDLLIVDITTPALGARGDLPWESRWVDGALLQAGERETVEQYHDLRWRVFGQWLLSRALPSFCSNRTLSACLSLHKLTGYSCFDDALGMDEWGYRPTLFEVTAQRRHGLTQLALSQYGFLLAEDHLAGGACRAVTDLVELCQAENIPLAIVVMPEGTAFHGLYRDRFVQEANQFFADLSQRTPVIDARTWIPDDEFFDQHHLLPTGAQRFTQRLESTLQHLLPKPRDELRESRGSHPL